MQSDLLHHASGAMHLGVVLEVIGLLFHYCPNAATVLILVLLRVV
jgi:hypothetical protein